jgi:hypothetical protein
MRHSAGWQTKGAISRRSSLELLDSRLMLSTVPPRIIDIEVASTSWSSEFVNFVQDSAEQSRGYSIPLQSAQMSSLTWSNIDQIILRFDEDVHVDIADLSLSGVNVVAYQFTDFHYDPIDHVAIWTLAAPLDKDRFQIDLDASGADAVRDLDGNVLDGEWVNKVSTVSGNGVAGGDFQFTFHVQPTDVDNNGRITTNDYAWILQLNGKCIGDSAYKAARDIDGNGTINSTDWQEAVDRYFEQRPIGNPAGFNNDAPTTAGFDLVEITDAAMDTVVSLTSHFGDAEAGGSGLTYSLLSYTNESIFDTVYIDQTTNSLIVNAADAASGRSMVIIRATDSSGLTVDAVITVDVNYENQAPEIHDLIIANGEFDTWVVYGRIVDPDDDASNFIVNFAGVFTIRSAVDEDGYFIFAVVLQPGQCGIEEVVTYDPHGLESDTYFREVGHMT